jgi:hypothetical protein
MYSILRTEEKGIREYLVTDKNIEYFRPELKPFFVATDIETFEEADAIKIGFRDSEEIRVKALKLIKLCIQY